MILLVMYLLLFINYTLLGVSIVGFLMTSSLVDFLMAAIHFIVGLLMHAGIEEARSEDENNRK